MIAFLMFFAWLVLMGCSYGVKKHFHCSSKDAHYIIGVARRKKIIDISAGYVTLA